MALGVTFFNLTKEKICQMSIHGARAVPVTLDLGGHLIQEAVSLLNRKLHSRTHRCSGSLSITITNVMVSLNKQLVSWGWIRLVGRYRSWDSPCFTWCIKSKSHPLVCYCIVINGWHLICFYIEYNCIYLEDNSSWMCLFLHNVLQSLKYNKCWCDNTEVS